MSRKRCSAVHSSRLGSGHNVILTVEEQTAVFSFTCRVSALGGLGALPTEVLLRDPVVQIEDPRDGLGFVQPCQYLLLVVKLT